MKCVLTGSISGIGQARVDRRNRIRESKGKTKEYNQK